MKGLQTTVGSWGQIIAGLLLALGQLIGLVANCLNGVTPLDACIDQLPVLFIGVIAAANGLANLGIGSKVEDVKTTTRKIELTGKATEAKVEAVAETTVATEAKVENLPQQ